MGEESDVLARWVDSKVQDYFGLKRSNRWMRQGL